MACCWLEVCAHPEVAAPAAGGVAAAAAAAPAAAGVAAAAAGVADVFPAFF